MYLKFLIDELTNTKVKINVDNQSTITLMKTGVMNRRSKHIEVRYHFINGKSRGKIINHYLLSN